MNLSQKLVSFIFFISYGIRTAITCFAMDQFISVLGSQKLGTYFSISAVISIVSVCTFSLLNKKLSNLSRFIGLHFFILASAISCIIVGRPEFTAQVTFLCMIGLGLMIYFSNWSIASIFINPFESKRIFPLLGVFAQLGMVAGSLFAMGSNYGISKSVYLPCWLLIEVIILCVAIFLKTKESENRDDYEAVSENHKVGIKALVSHYSLIPKMAVWIFLWGITFTGIKSLTGKSFGEFGVNLTALYGGLDLSAAILSALLLTTVYPKALKLLKLGGILLTTSLILFVVGTTYLVFDNFVFAITAFLIFKLLEETFITMSISTQFGLYSSQHRDRLRLLAEILSRSAGAMVVGFLFLVPPDILPWALAGILALLVYFGLGTRTNFHFDVSKFLESKESEEKNNAVALFDRVNNRGECKRVLHLLKTSDDLPLRINILNTFSNLRTPTPALLALDLLMKEKNQSLQIAILRYFDQLDLEELDPFLNYRFIESLKEICSSQYSNILRSLGMRILLQKSPMSETVEFVIKALNDPDDRVVANAIDGLNYVDYPGIVDLLTPFLSHGVARVRANAVIALWKYRDCRLKVKKSLNEMLHGGDYGSLMSGIYAVGEVQDVSKMEFLKNELKDCDKGIERGILIALLKMNCVDYYRRVIEIILGDDIPQAINVCYLTMRVKPEILNEKIIADIYHKGEEFRKIAIDRYSSCGAFCREQIELLEGKAFNRLKSGTFDIRDG